ncbi:MAG: MATE family efflux transporter [Flavobacteriaceae bacterium]|jgi:putative MATE family efflux protein|nr:MATE family efflux transporter [Flavobacteriaceae bacterium]
MEIVQKTQNTEELETREPGKLLWKYAIPSIIGTVVIALYNIIDSIYIGHGPGLGDHAIGGLGVLLPVMTFISGIGMLVGAGAATRTSIYLGQKDKESVEKVLGNSVSLACLLTLIIVVIAYIFTDYILLSVGATPETFPFAKEFLYYYLPGNFLLTVNFALSSVMRASGYPKKSMYIMLIGVSANIVLAPFFIFILEWGMKGAAMASNLSMFIASCIMVEHFLNKKSTILLQWSKLKLESKVTWSIINIGFAPFFMLITAAIVVFFVNNRLNEYGGSTAIEAYAIANRLIMVIIMILVGLTQGMQPIVGYNFGAKKIDRVKKTLNYTLKVGVSVGAVGLVFGFFLPHLIIQPFNPSPVLAKEATWAIRIMTITLPLSGFQMVVSGFFQCIGKAVHAFFLSMIRQFVTLVPMLYILPGYFGLDGIWYSVPISDSVSTLLTSVIFFLQIRQFKRYVTKNT